MVIKIILLVVFFGVMVGVGIYCRKNATDVNGFVLGGRSVGPWLTAFAYGTSYFSRHLLLLGGHLHRLRGTVRLEIRYRLHLDRYRQRADRLVPRVGYPRTPHAHHDAAPQLRDHARILRQAL